MHNPRALLTREETLARQDDMAETTLQDRIRERLKAVGKSAAAASVEAGLGNTAIRDILSGKTKSPQLATLIKLAGPLECTLEYLAGSPPRPPRPPEPYDSYTAFDPHPTDITDELAVGVFKERDISWTEDRPRTGSFERHVVYNDPDRPDWRPALYRMTDHSLEGIRILAGDVLTAISHPEDAKIELTDGMLVIVRHSIMESRAEEVSARLVEIVDGVAHLVCRPNRGEIRPIVIRERALSDTQAANNFMLNYYWSDEGSASIEGVVIRLTRDLV